MNRYDPKDIETKWQQVWADTDLHAAIDGDPRPKYYMLTEFPYPSGDGLHAGHAREYTLGDVIARHKRMQGHNVLFPMGYDSFGLPTENYAIKHKMRPQDATDQNVANFRAQFKSLGYSIDWSREINTSDPSYYKWTQWLFLRFLEAGLAYQAEMAINWCPKEKTGLANEEVAGGVHERCGTPVEKKLIKQWMLRITAYADRLIEGLKDVDYPPRIADQQINWIGRSEGAEIDFKLRGITDQPDDHHLATVYTTRPDTLFGATFLVVSPELASKWLSIGWKATDKVRAYITHSLAETEIERQGEDKAKTGVDTGITALHPVTGDEIPVWVADYVLGGYGTGAIMSVPAHDSRDLAFAHTHHLPVVKVIQGEDGFTGYGELIHSSEFDGLEGDAAKQAITKKLQESGQARPATKYKLRDWIFSRQHYWGEPIPVIHCSKDGVVPVPADQLPVVLPEVVKYEPTDSGESPLATVTDGVNTTCPQCGGPARRETDTMPNWAGSSWYYLRYTDAHNDQVFADPDKLKYWLPADLYLGGMEHTTLHLLYSRFWHEFLYDQGLVPTPEPYAARRGQGIVLAADGRKMSKSLGNVINPNDMIARYGADSFRLYILFMAPYDETTPWSDERLNGVSRFLYRVWTIAQELIANDSPSGTPDGILATTIDRATHKTLKKLHDDYAGMRFNTTVSALMELVNVLTDGRTKAALLLPANADLAQRTVRTLILMLAPSVPHIAEELWHDLGEEGSVHVAHWPAYDPSLLHEDIFTIAVQVNGKLRGQVMVSADASDADVQAAAQADPNVAKHLDGGTLRKTIVVPRKLVNFVVSP
jgi:leucyl-tRNA synthetase